MHAFYHFIGVKQILSAYSALDLFLKWKKQQIEFRILFALVLTKETRHASILLQAEEACPFFPIQQSGLG